MPLYDDPFSQSLIGLIHQARPPAVPRAPMQVQMPVIAPGGGGGGGAAQNPLGIGFGDAMKLGQLGRGKYDEWFPGEEAVASPDLADASPFEMPGFADAGADPSAGLTSAPTIAATAEGSTVNTGLAGLMSSGAGAAMPFVGPGVSLLQGRKKEAMGGALGAGLGLALAPFTFGLSVPVLTAAGSMIGGAQED